MEFKIKLKVNDCEKVEGGFLIYSLQKRRRKVGKDKYEMLEEPVYIKSDIDLGRHLGKTITVNIGQPFSPKDSLNIYYRIQSVETQS